MIAKKEPKINGEEYKPKRSISTKIGNEVDEENFNSKILKSRHRKTASSYFLGSYVSGNELSKFLQEFNGKNCDNHNNSGFEKKCEINDLKDDNNYNNINKGNENNNENLFSLNNASFYSYSVDDNNEYNNKENGEEDTVLIKEGEQSSQLNKDNISTSYTDNHNNNFWSNNPFYELEKNNENYGKEKSFIPLKNGLKYIKDKEERVTESYLLALNGGESNKKNGNNPYLLTASIIEEEKSEFLESTSKKNQIVKASRFIKDLNFKKKNIENELNLVKDIKDNIIKKSEGEENKENININFNKNNNDINKKNSKKELNIKLNKIKIEKNSKDEKKKKCLRKNKENLLNSFYNLSFNRSIPELQNTQKKDENASKTNANDNKIIKDNNRINNKDNPNNKITNFNFIIKDKIQQCFFKNKEEIKNNVNYKKKRTYSYNGGYISYLSNQRFNTENNNKAIDRLKNINMYYNIPKNNLDKKNNKINKMMNKSLLGTIKYIQNSKIPHNKFDKSKAQIICRKIYPYNNFVADTLKLKKMNKKLLLDLSNHRKSLSKTKTNLDKISKHRKIFSSCGLENEIFHINLSNINRCETFKKAKPDTNNTENNYEKNNYSQIVRKRNKKNFNSKNKIILPTYSDSSSSRVKQKIKYRLINYYENKNSKKQINIRKANSGFIKVKLDSVKKNKNELKINISNKSQTLIILNDKVKFQSYNKKNEVLNKIKNDSKDSNNNYIILCQTKNVADENKMIFLGLFKYFESKKGFVKIYGSEESPNHILLKDLNKNNYFIYENKIIQKAENKIQILLEQLNSFYFSFNSIIICEK